MRRFVVLLLLSTAPALAQDEEPIESFELEEEAEPAVWTKEGADGTVRKTFSSERLRFCNDPHYRVPASERRSSSPSSPLSSFAISRTS